MKEYQKMKEAMAELNSTFAERQAEVNGLVVSILARKHLVLIGPPGTAKTEMTKAFAARFASGSFFPVLLTKFSTLEDIFGPVDLAQLKAGNYTRRWDRKAADCRVFFPDECFKGSSAILNGLLKLMQERKVDDGTAEKETPLECVIGASNEYPEAGLDALYDRFTLRFWVDYIRQPKNLAGILAGTSAGLTEILPKELAKLQAEVSAIPFGPAEIDRLLTVKASLENAGFRPSDRTWIGLKSVLQAQAVVNGGKLDKRAWRILSDCLWSRAEDRPKIQEIVLNASDPYALREQAIRDSVAEIMAAIPAKSLMISGQLSKPNYRAALSTATSKIAAEINRAEILEKESSDPTLVSEIKSQIEVVSRLSYDALMGK